MTDNEFRDHCAAQAMAAFLQQSGTMATHMVAAHAFAFAEAMVMHRAKVDREAADARAHHEAVPGPAKVVSGWRR